MNVWSKLVHRMEKRHVVPLLGLAFSTLLCLVLIHVWFAAWVAFLLEMPLPLAHACLVMFLVLLQTWRLVQIVRDRDIGTQWVGRLMQTNSPANEGDRHGS